MKKTIKKILTTTDDILSDIWCWIVYDTPIAQAIVWGVVVGVNVYVILKIGCAQ